MDASLAQSAQRHLLDEYSRLMGDQYVDADAEPGVFGETTDVVPTSVEPSAYEPAPNARVYDAHVEDGIANINNSLPSSGPRVSGGGDAQPNSRASTFEAEQLSFVLDEDCNKLKRDVMDLFKVAKSQLTERAQLALDAERRECARSLSSKQAEIDTLVDAQTQKDDAIKRLYTVIARAVDFKLNSVMAVHEKYLRIHVLAAWKMFRTNRKMVRRKIEQWMSYHSRTFVIGRALKAWRSEVHKNIRQSMRLRYESIMEQERNKQMSEQAALIDGLRAEISELSNKLESEEAGRKLLEEQMKRAFMRGVCALNIEAMGLMKSGHAPSNTSEFSEASLRGSSVQHSRQVEEADSATPDAPDNSNVEPIFTSPGVKDAPVRLSTGSASAALERFLAQVGRK